MALETREETELLLSELRDATLSCTDPQEPDDFPLFVAEALHRLGHIEAQALSNATKQHMSKSAERGTKSGRRKCMTPERIAVATRMLLSGASGLTVHRAVKGLPGPNLGQSTYYLWQKNWKEAVREDEISNVSLHN